MIGSTLLSIKPEFAQRIYDREKIYELRKSKPDISVPRVFLFETNGSQSISGLALINSIITDTPQNLWKKVGEKATSKERFFKYFNGFKIAHALSISKILRFVSPVNVQDIQKARPGFSSPQNYFYLHASSPLNILLFHRVIEAVQCKDADLIKLKTIQPCHINAFKKLAFKELRPFYDEINDDFVKSITSTCGPGFTTMFREMFELYDKDELIGFTTITYKLGNCIKTGPTVFFEKNRQAGLGQRLRKTFDQIATAYGIRKIYCTCPSSNLNAVRYLFKSNHLLESTLRKQYKRGSDELVFGKVVFDRESNGPVERVISREEKQITKIKVCRDNFQRVKPLLKKLMAENLFRVDDQWCKDLLDSSKGNPVASSKKERKIYIAESAKGPVALLLATPKRGRCIKLILLEDTSHKEGLLRLLRTAERSFGKRLFRKFYAYVPVKDPFLQSTFIEARYLVEGMLREPFKKSKDFLVMAKFRENRSAI